jgi:hypothetical protein
MSISALVNKEIGLDLTNRKNPDVPAIFVVREDAGTTKFTITITNDSVAVDLTDLTVRIYFKKNDGTITQGEPTIDNAVSGIISYSLQSNDTAAEGPVLCQIIITDGTGNQISTFNFTFTVQLSVYDDAAVESTTAFTSLSLLADNLRHQGEYDAGTTYYTNNIVEYNGSSYMALQTTTGNVPPTYPTVCNDYWCVMANGYAFEAEYAENILISDAGGYYDNTTVEAALQHVGALLAKYSYQNIGGAL